jgi:hypothetical protein
MDEHGSTRIKTDKGPSNGKRFGDEINTVKEHSAEAVSRNTGDIVV